MGSGVSQFPPAIRVIAVRSELFRYHRRAIVGDELHAFDVYFMQVLSDELVAAFDEVFSSPTGHGFNPAAVGKVTYEAECTSVAVMGLFVHFFDVAGYPTCRSRAPRYRAV